MTMHNEVPTDAQAKAPTWVLWDINRCPVPRYVDAGIIGPSIKKAVNNLGYTGPLTITAIGVLTEVPFDVLVAIYSSGIGLNHINEVTGIDLELFLWGWKNPPPANVMLISHYGNSSPTLATLQVGGYNVIWSICSDSSSTHVFTPIWQSLLAMLLAGDCKLEVGDNCSENPAFVCSTCDGNFDVKDFLSFMRHLSVTEHEREEESPYFPHAHYDSYCQKEDATIAQKMMMMHPKAPVAEAEDPTWVWWDINRCPVPADVDVRIIGPCIKSAVDNLGYTGPLNIIAIGILTDVPLDVLRAIYSSGIALHHVPTEMNGIKNVLYWWSTKNPSPTNFMLLSGERVFGATLESLASEGYNIIRSLFPYDANKVDSALNLSFTGEGCFFLWRSLLTVLRSDVDELEKNERGESALVCSTCDLKVDAKDFERFITHLYSKEHGLKELQFYPQDCSSREKQDATTIKHVLKCFRAGLRSCQRKAEEERKAEEKARAEIELEEQHVRRQETDEEEEQS